MNEKEFDVAIIGGGVAGFSAAMYAGRLGLRTILFDKTPGGTIMLAGEVENYPGFKSIRGFELSKKIQEHALLFNPEIVKENAEKIERKEKSFIVTSKSRSIIASTIIFATGTEWRKLDVPGERQFERRGVHYCALCDGPFYKGKVLAVVGGGDGAAKEALILSNIASKIYLIFRKEDIKAEPLNVERIKKSKNIEMINKAEVIEIIGNEKLEKIKLSRNIDGSSLLKVDGVFIDIGRVPQTKLAEDVGVKLNEKKEIITNKAMETNIKGFFAAGDVTDSPFKQAIVSAAEGSTAAYSAYTYIKREFRNL